MGPFQYTVPSLRVCSMDTLALDEVSLEWATV